MPLTFSTSLCFQHRFYKAMQSPLLSCPVLELCIPRRTSCRRPCCNLHIAGSYVCGQTQSINFVVKKRVEIHEYVFYVLIGFFCKDCKDETTLFWLVLPCEETEGLPTKNTVVFPIASSVVSHVLKPLHESSGKKSSEVAPYTRKNKTEVEQLCKRDWQIISQTSCNWVGQMRKCILMNWKIDVSCFSLLVRMWF